MNLTKHEKVFNVVRIAGAQYADGYKIWPIFNIGDQLSLIPEPTNPHDPNAVQVWYAGNRLGYIARDAGTNVEIARWLQLGGEYEARLIRKDPSAHPYSQLFMKVTFVYYTRSAVVRPGTTLPISTSPNSLRLNEIYTQLDLLRADITELMRGALKPPKVARRTKNTKQK